MRPFQRLLAAFALPACLAIAPAALAQAASAQAAPAECKSQVVTENDLPALFERVFGEAPADCRTFTLRVPVRWTRDAAGAVTLAPTDKAWAWPATDPTRIEFLTRQVGMKARAAEFEATLFGAVPRAPQKTRKEIRACRKENPYLGAACEKQVWDLSLGIVNADDIALPAVMPLPTGRAQLSSADGVYIELDFGVDERGVVEDDFNSTRTVVGRLSAMRLVDGADGVLANGRASPLSNVSAPFPGYVWSKAPDWGSMARYYPDRAMRQEQTGRAVIVCRVGYFGRLRACAVESETPAAFGFGDAGLRMARLFVMEPFTSEGEPVLGRTVRVPIAFLLPE